MKKTYLLALFLVFTSVPQIGFAKDGGLPHFKKHENYASVRTAMIKAGWKPFHIEGADACGSGDARCVGRPEMAFCAGTGQANCKFTWKKNDKIVGICTVGENPAVYDGICNN